MNVAILGNGYDLNYQLPTSYRNFLLTIDFLMKAEIENLNTIGDVFGNKLLQEQDYSIKTSYDKYKQLYDDVELDKEKIKELVNIAKENVWFSYFLKSFNREAGWIDFEREIAFVIDCYKGLFKFTDEKLSTTITIKKKDLEYVILKMTERIINVKERNMHGLVVDVKKEYITEYPQNSRNYKVDKTKIIAFLNEELCDFIKCLKIYLQCFIDVVTEQLINNSKIEQLNVLRSIDAVVTLNYTNTFEYFNPNTKIFHLHGNVNDKIVLGINPDLSDDKASVDTSFLVFKKYYQRTFLGTDTDYLNWIRDFSRRIAIRDDVHLIVMGHSLDITDKDIITDLFGIASEITVLYHNDIAKSQHITNLISIFGKTEFDKLRNEHSLDFLCLSSDLSELCHDLYENADENYKDIKKGDSIFAEYWNY